MIDLLIAILSTIGALAILFASIGILRMPDFYLRLSVTVKAATLGIGLFLLCTAILFPDISVTTKAIAISFFLILTTPVAAHMIGRSAYKIGTPKWKGTILDDLEEDIKCERYKLQGLSKEEIEEKPTAAEIKEEDEADMEIFEEENPDIASNVEKADNEIPSFEETDAPSLKVEILQDLQEQVEQADQNPSDDTAAEDTASSEVDKSKKKD